MSVFSSWNNSVILLGEANFDEWKHDIRAIMLGEGYLKLLDGTELSPSGGDALVAYQTRCNKAAAILLRSLSASVYHLVDERDAPSDMYHKLVQAHNQQLSANRFHAMNKLFSLHKDADESLKSVITRIEQTMALLKSLRPSDYSLATLDDELMTLALLRSLPESSQVWSSSLFSKEQLTYANIKAQFNTQSNLFQNTDETAAKAFTFSRPVPSTAVSKWNLICTFCDGKGHSEETCYMCIEASKKAKKEVKERKKKKRQTGKSAVIDDTAKSDSVESPNVLLYI